MAVVGRIGGGGWLVSVVVVGGLVLAGCSGSAGGSGGGSGSGSAGVERSAGKSEDCVKPGAVCENMDFSGMDLAGRDFSEAVLTGARFDGANLSGADLSGAVLTGSSWGSAACDLPMPTGCLRGYEWDTLAAPVRLRAGKPVGAGKGFAGDSGSTAASVPATPTSTPATSTPTSSGGGPQLDQVKFDSPTAVEVSPDSRMAYIADAGNHRVRRLDLGTGRIVTVAGSGNPCKWDIDRCGDSVDGADPLRVNLSKPSGLALDQTGSSLYISDADSHLIWRLDLPVGVSAGGAAAKSAMRIVAGTGRSGQPKIGEGLDPVEAPLSRPTGLALTGSTLYVADTGNNAVRKIDLDQPSIALFAGSPDGTACVWLVKDTCGGDVAATKSTLSGPRDVAVLADGTVLIADTGSAAVRAVNTDGKIRTVLAPPSGTEVEKAGEYPKPSFLAPSAGGQVFIGPADAAGTAVARLDKTAIAKRSTWADLSIVAEAGIGSCVDGVCGGGAVAPNSRYLITTRPGAHQIQPLPAVVGPNIKNADFTNADLSSTVYKPTIFNGVYQDGAKLTGVRLVGARITNSRLTSLDQANLQGVVVDNARIDKVTGSDFSWADIGNLDSLTVVDSCLANARLSAAAYPGWKLTNTSLTGLHSAQDNTDVVFADSAFDTVDIADASPTGKWVFKGGTLASTNFSPGSDNGNISFSETNLDNTPRNPLSSKRYLPDYTKTPNGWGSNTTNKNCHTDQRDLNVSSRGGNLLLSVKVTGTSINDMISLSLLIEANSRGTATNLDHISWTGSGRDLASYPDDSEVTVTDPKTKTKFTVRAGDFNNGVRQDFNRKFGPLYNGREFKIKSSRPGKIFSEDGVLTIKNYERIGGLKYAATGKCVSLNSSDGGPAKLVDCENNPGPVKAFKGDFTPSPMNYYYITVGDIIRIGDKYGRCLRLNGSTPEVKACDSDRSESWGKDTYTNGQGTAVMSWRDGISPYGAAWPCLFADSGGTQLGAVQTGGACPDSGFVEFIPDATPVPSVPSEVKAAQTGTGEITVSWEPPAPAAGVEITGYEVTSSRPGIESCSVLAAERKCVFNVGVSDGTDVTYGFTVVAKGGKTDSDPVWTNNVKIYSQSTAKTIKALEQERDSKIAGIETERSTALAAANTPERQAAYIKDPTAAILATTPTGPFKNSIDFTEYVAYSQTEPEATKDDWNDLREPFDKCFPGFLEQPEAEFLPQYLKRIEESPSGDCDKNTLAFFKTMAVFAAIGGTATGLDAVTAGLIEPPATETDYLKSYYDARMNSNRKVYDAKIRWAHTNPG